MWLRREVVHDEEGQKVWEQTVTWLNTPPAAVTRDAPAAVSRPSRAFAALAPDAPVTRAQQASALSAFMGTMGGSPT